ncbi:DEKNAAC103357 [Brettanomyces naardenensis]|uniref:DEKNAAC103357 n=1 Tax=Brettanomyces naardenensis TaxID=13370 RepID=A0A448YNT2_BRENA|nr:DEKNAAC103357 [Brettanomyces naardenensis]
MPKGRLAFNDPLISTAGDSIPAKTVLSRLEALYNELSSIDQDSVDIDSLNSVKDALVNRKLLRHSNHGVQAFVACCLSDVLRLYAPDAPYTASQLSDIFKLFFRQLRQLGNPDSGFYHQHVYLVTRMAEVKTAVLLTDLPDADKLTESIFDVVYSLASSAHLDEELEPLLLELLTEVIGESSKLPEKSIKLILNKFLQHSKLPKNASLTSVPGWRFTLRLCRLNADRMSRLVTLSFSELVYESTRRYEDEEEADKQANADDSDYFFRDIEQLKKIHLILVEIWKYVPEMLASVMGLINNEFEADDKRIRIFATEAVGEMLAYHSTSLNFVREHHETYTSWIKKPLDCSAQVRIAWIKTTGKVFEARSDIADDLREGVLKTLVDSEEKVRLCTVSEFRDIKSSVFVKRAVSETIMTTLCQLLREKHTEIRNACLSLLSSVYNDVFGLLYSGDAKLDKLVGWIPDEIFKLVYINDRSVNAGVDLCVFENIFPFDPENNTRVVRLLTVLKHFTEKSKSSFLAVIRRQVQLSAMISKLLSLAEEYYDGLDDTLKPKIEKAVDWLAAEFPEEYNSSASLRQFLKLNNHRYFRLLKLAISTMTSDYEAVYDSLSEIFSKLSDPRNFRIEGTPSVSLYEMESTLKLLCYRSSNILYSKSNVAEILRISRDADDELCSTAMETINSMSTLMPDVLKANITSLIRQVCEDGLNPGETDLKAINNFVKKFPDVVSDKLDNVEAFFDKLVQFAIKGTPSRSKYAVQIIASSHYSLKDSYLQDILEGVWPLDEKSELLNTRLAAIAELFLVNLVLMEPKTKELSSFLASRILLRNEGLEESDSDENGEAVDPNEWISDEELYTTEAHCNSKLLALKVFVNWLRVIQKDSQSDIDAVADPVFELLNSIIINGGEIVSQKDVTFPTPKKYQSRLRLEAGLQLLKLAECSVYDSKLDQKSVSRLVFLIQDENEHARRLFMRKLVKRLTGFTIPKRFVPLVFFIAQEPQKNLRDETTTWVRAAYQRQINDQDKNSLLFETSYVRFLHMLSHHQELCEIYKEYNDVEEPEKDEVFVRLVNFALTYIVLTLSLIANPDNVSLLFYLTQRVKQYKDATMDEDNNALYFLSDLAQLAIKRIAENRVWNISTWPGKFALPADLYQKNRDKDSLKDVVATCYIPEKYFRKALDIVKSRCRHVSDRPSARNNVKHVRPFEEEAQPRKVRVLEDRSNKLEADTEKLPKEFPVRRSAIARRVVDYNESE